MATSTPTTEPLFADPRELSDPLALTPPEQREYTRLANNHDLGTVEKVGLALGAAFLLHRAIMSRKIQELLGKESDPKPSSLRLAISAAYQLALPKWLGMATPAVLAGYRIGVKEARAGHLSEDELYEIAESYAKKLGEHYNEVSADALAEGFQAQINRKVPAARAARMVAQVYGVPPRAMNTLISIWNSEDPKRLTNLPMDSVRDIRAKVFVDAQLRNRAGQIGESEAWSTKSQAKQIVWAYGVQKGIIPQDARRIWVTAKDEKVCKHCGPLHRKDAAVGEEFKTTLGKVWTPPLHVNCRCDVILEFATGRRLAVAKNYEDQPRDEHGRWTEGYQATPEEVREYTHERCGSLAFEIHKQTGWPVIGLVGEEGWLHALVERPDGKLLDIRGAHSYNDVADQWDEYGNWDFEPLWDNWWGKDDAKTDPKTQRIAEALLKTGHVEVKKAQGDDPYDRDSHGRFAPSERRRVRPHKARPFATPTQLLHDQVNAPSLQEDLSRQVTEALQQPAEPQQMKMTDTRMKMGQQKLGSHKLTDRTLGQGSLKKLGEGQKQKISSKKLGTFKLSDPGKHAIKEKLYRLAEQDPNRFNAIHLKDGSVWVPADSPMVVLVPGYETSYNHDFVLNDYSNRAIELGDRAFSGLDLFYNELDEYWNDEMQAMMEDWWNSGQTVSYFTDDTEYEISPDDFYEAMVERVQGIPPQQSDPLRLEPVDGEGPPISISAFHLGQYLNLDEWVDAVKPDIVILNHVNPETSERGNYGLWTVPGKFKRAAEQGPDLDIGHLPHTFYYAEPTD